MSNTRSLIAMLVDKASGLAQGAIELERHPTIRQRRAFATRLGNTAASFLAQVYAADAASRGADLRSNRDAAIGFAGARKSLGELQHLLRLIDEAACEDGPTAAALLTLANEVLALLLAASIELRRGSFSRAAN